MARRRSKDSKAFADWMEYAESDIIASAQLIENEKTLLLSAFHSHQAIEKSLKAFMLSEKGYAPDGHNIIFLCKTAAKFEKGYFDLIDECITLNNYYIQTRYPPDFPLEIDKSRAKLLNETAKTVFDFTKKQIEEI